LMWLQLPLLAGSAYIFVRFVSRYCGGSIPVSLAGIALILSPCQWENLFWALEISVALMLFFSFAALERTACFAESGRLTHALQAMVLAFLAACSQGAGLGAALLVAILLFANGKGRQPRLLLTLGIYGLALLLLYALTHWVVHTDLGQGPTGIAFAAIARQVPQYLATYFGNVLRPSFVLPSDVPRTLAGTGLFVALAYIYVKGRSRALLSPGSFFVAFGCMIGLGICLARLSGGIYQPDAPRYYSMASLAWLGLLCLSTEFAKWKSAFQYGLLLLIGFAYSKSLYVEYRIAPYRKANLEKMHVALCSGETVGLAFDKNMSLKFIDLNVIRSAFCKPDHGTR